MTSESTTHTWSPPTYDLSTKPDLKHSFAIKDDENHENFSRNARWCPDGSVFMAHCENRTLQLFYPSVTSTRPSLVFQQSAPILDFTWFPTASPNDPSSFCFLTSVRECPVKLLDASDGRLRASYKIIDHRERFIAPHCMTFNLDASMIYCGCEDSIEIFNVSRPGEGSRIATTPSRQSKDGLKGIISALAFSPSYSTDSDTFFAVGTLNPTPSNLVLYNDSQIDVPLMFIGGGERSAVTQLRFNPMNPHILYAAYRRREAILAWDLRSDVNIPFAKYVIPDKPVTNQKMWFDVNIAGTRLSAGDQNGNVHIFDLTIPANEEDSSEMVVKEPDLTFSAHSDSIGGVAFHPYQPLLLSVSGSRHYSDDDSHDHESSSSSSSSSSEDGSETEDGDENEDEDGDEDEAGAMENDQYSVGIGVTSNRKTRRTRPIATDSSIKTWWFETNDSTSRAVT